jgi:hypothetical protein
MVFLVAALTIPLAGCNQVAIHKAEQRVAHNLIDPSSAQFREVELGKDDLVCGQVNSKNRMGGYTGFRGFMVQGDEVMFEPDVSEFDDGPPAWNQNADELLLAKFALMQKSECGKFSTSANLNTTYSRLRENLILMDVRAVNGAKYGISDKEEMKVADIQRDVVKEMAKELSLK